MSQKNINIITDLYPHNISLLLVGGIGGVNTNDEQYHFIFGRVLYKEKYKIICFNHNHILIRVHTWNETIPAWNKFVPLWNEFIPKSWHIYGKILQDLE